MLMARGINDDHTFRDYEAYNDTLMEGNDAIPDDDFSNVSFCLHSS